MINLNNILKEINNINMSNILQYDLADYGFDYIDDFEYFENAWKGGVADFGDKTAAIDIQRIPEYYDYIDVLRQKIEKEAGSDVIRMYRAISDKQLQQWKDGRKMDPMGFTTDENVARSWHKFAPINKVSLHVIEVDVPLEAIIMRGHPAESELVVDPNELTIDSVREI